ncbi:MAG TPA: DUF1697 domain-containing protein [Thermoplasmata archaeon]|nr:DUF1697 domain-containing protein [Thermoplasmata archaeon]
MPITHIALLRAVNVGSTIVDPADLRTIAAEMGYGRVRSWLRTGNLLFDAPARPTRLLETRLADATGRRLGLATRFFVRTAPEWSRVVAGNPYPDRARSDPSHLVVVVLDGTPTEDAVRRLRASIVGRETVHPGERCLYVTYPDGIGRSKLTLARIEDAVGSPGTARNWNTTVKLDALARAHPPA